MLSDVISLRGKLVKLKIRCLTGLHWAFEIMFMSGATAMKGEPLKVIRSKESGVRCYGVYNRRKCKEPLQKKILSWRKSGSTCSRTIHRSSPKSSMAVSSPSSQNWTTWKDREPSSFFFRIKVSPPQIIRFSLRYNTNGNFFVMTSSHTSSLCLPPSSLHSLNCSRNSSTLFMASICSLPSSASSDQPSD